MRISVRNHGRGKHCTSAILLQAAGRGGCPMFRSTGSFLMFLSCFPAISQNQIKPPSFEAAAVNPKKSGEIGPASDFKVGGRFTDKCAPKDSDGPCLPRRARGRAQGPGWLRSERFDIVAKAL